MFKITNSPDNLHVATYQLATIEVLNLLKQQVCSHIVVLPGPVDLYYWFKTFTGCYMWPNGAKYYYKNGKLHRDGDKPAIILADGTKKYYKNGKLHREDDKPAVIWADGSKWYYKNGQEYYV